MSGLNKRLSDHADIISYLKIADKISKFIDCGFIIWYRLLRSVQVSFQLQNKFTLKILASTFDGRFTPLFEPTSIGQSYFLYHSFSIKKPSSVLVKSSRVKSIEETHKEYYMNFATLSLTRLRSPDASNILRCLMITNSVKLWVTLYMQSSLCVTSIIYLTLPSEVKHPSCQWRHFNAIICRG